MRSNNSVMSDLPGFTSTPPAATWPRRLLAPHTSEIGLIPTPRLYQSKYLPAALLGHGQPIHALRFPVCDLHLRPRSYPNCYQVTMRTFYPFWISVNDEAPAPYDGVEGDYEWDWSTGFPSFFIYRKDEKPPTKPVQYLKSVSDSDEAIVPCHAVYEFLLVRGSMCFNTRDRYLADTISREIYPSTPFGQRLNYRFPLCDLAPLFNKPNETLAQHPHFALIRCAFRIAIRRQLNHLSTLLGDHGSEHDASSHEFPYGVYTGLRERTLPEAFAQYIYLFVSDYEQTHGEGVPFLLTHYKDHVDGCRIKTHSRCYQPDGVREFTSFVLTITCQRNHKMTVTIPMSDFLRGDWYRPTKTATQSTTTEMKSPWEDQKRLLL